jgi:hypothetical protein
MTSTIYLKYIKSWEWSINAEGDYFDGDGGSLPKVTIVFNERATSVLDTSRFQTFFLHLQ